MKKSLKSLFMGTGVLAATVLGGCFVNDSGPTSSGVDNDQPANLVISMGVKDVNSLSKPGLGKTAAITLNKLVVTLTSSVETDAVIRDTVIASDTEGSPFVSASDEAQQVLKNYPVLPLRNWTIEVKTLDINDSTIHIATSTQNNLGIGENRTVVLNLTSRFVVYAAKFTLPDSIGSQSADGKQKLYVNRFVMVVDGDTVRDTTSTPHWFIPDTAHVVEYDYVEVSEDPISLELYIYADSLGSWDPSMPIFGDTILVSSIDTTYSPELPWMGPGSPHDPNYDPENPGGGEAALEINIGAVGLVTINNNVSGTPLPKRQQE